MLLSAVSVLVVAQSSSEIPEGLMNNRVCDCTFLYAVFGIALQAHFTKVFCDNGEETMLCHCEMCS